MHFSFNVYFQEVFSAAVDTTRPSEHLSSLSQDKRRLLILCMENPSNNLFDVLGIGPNVIWMLREQKDAPTPMPDNLRLDSHWYTFSDSLDMDEVNITEHYRIKKKTEVLSRSSELLFFLKKILLALKIN